MAVGSRLARVKQVELALQEEAVELPFSLVLLPQLHTLVMWNVGKMQRLPSDMGWAVPQLRVLQIHCARELRELPDSIGATSCLHQLHLFECPALHHLPASLTQLACLHQLHVENTGQHCLPSEFAQLTRLRSFRRPGRHHSSLLGSSACLHSSSTNPSSSAAAASASSSAASSSCAAACSSSAGMGTSA
ncbi:unnamed protein product [Closterium sp. NIES-65]|nr:unnamed protein product [Closterium sp. NIES-65]